MWKKYVKKTVNPFLTLQLGHKFRSTFYFVDPSNNKYSNAKNIANLWFPRTATGFNLL